MGRSTRRARLVGLVGLMLVGCPANDSKRDAPSPTPEPSRPSPVANEAQRATEPAKTPATYADRLSQGLARAQKAEAVARNNARSALVFARAAAEYMGLARLSADYDHYAKAEELLEAALELQDEPTAYMLRARLNYSLHRLEPAAADLKHLQQQPPDDQTRGSRLLLQADLAFQQGRYDDAHKTYEAATQADESPAAMASLAYYRWRTADFDRAEELYRTSLKLYADDAAQPRAWTHLQLGLMDLERGRYDDALTHYRDAEQLLPGFWLIEEHIAEILTLQGETDKAKAMYVDIIERTGNPEFMDAMAGILLEEGDESAARSYVERAGTKYQERMAAYPEATLGHALDHYLEFGSPQRALEYAKKNHALRPNTESKVPLASAHLRAGQPDEALEVIEAALKTPIRTADLHATAAAVYEATGATKRAAEHAAAAKQLNPHVELPNTRP